jgi:pimeloyl-ACP methyl ester carboxylesterase
MDSKKWLDTLEGVAREYDAELLSSAERFFPAPPPIDPTLCEVRSGVVDMAWQSTVTPYLDEVVDAYLSYRENRTAHARFYFLNEGDRRPAIVTVHGYLGGEWVVEEARWPIGWLLGLGLDVAAPVLPFHAQRGDANSITPWSTTADPRFMNEASRQAVADIRALIRWLRTRGAPHVGIVGVSLGGYVSALLSTVSAEVDFVMPLTPLVSIARFAPEQGRFDASERIEPVHDALTRATWVVSPLARPCRLDPSRVLVVAAQHDELIPTVHVEQLANHFGCELLTIPGGHFSAMVRVRAFRALEGMLRTNGITRARFRDGA